MGDAAQVWEAPSTEPGQQRGGSSHQGQVAISSSHWAWVGRTTEQTHSCFGEGAPMSQAEKGWVLRVCQGCGREGWTRYWQTK